MISSTLTTSPFPVNNWGSARLSISSPAWLSNLFIFLFTDCRTSASLGLVRPSDGASGSGYQQPPGDVHFRLRLPADNIRGVRCGEAALPASWGFPATV